MLTDAELLRQLQTDVIEYKRNFFARSLMYGGTLAGVEAAWHVLRTFEVKLFHPELASLNVVQQHDMIRRGYEIVAQKHKCGAWALSGKVQNQVEREKISLLEGSVKLVGWLQEVEAEEERLIKEANENAARTS